MKLDRVGETNLNRYGNRMTIIKYNNALDIVIEFMDGFKFQTCYSNFRKGKIKSPYDRSVLDVGFLGEGFKPNEKTHQYKKWIGMMSRCYNPVEQSKHPAYIGCTVCDKWHNFQNFITWYDDNYYEIDEERMELDKDILHKGNKIYSPENCTFAPRNINGLFEQCYKLERHLPIGVSWAEDRQEYQSTCSDGSQKTIHLGFYSTPKQAFYKYKIYKEKLIRQIADEYKDRIPSRLYNAMINYQVEITD